MLTYIPFPIFFVNSCYVVYVNFYVIIFTNEVFIRLILVLYVVLFVMLVNIKILQMIDNIKFCALMYVSNIMSFTMKFYYLSSSVSVQFHTHTCII